MLGRLSLLGAVLALAAAANVQLAATITKTDGTVLTGRIIEENDLWVVMEVERHGAKMTLPVARSAIRAIDRGTTQPTATTGPTTTSAPAGPTYYPLPIKGEIGVEIKAEFLTEALTGARARKPDYVVLVFDTAGGSLEETDKLVNVLAEAKDLKPIAFVRKATSEAALAALTCPEIYLATDGIIGAALPEAAPAEGAPGAVERRRLLSMQVKARQAARLGGHSLLLARGMVDPDLELALVTKDGKPVVKPGRDGKELKAKGRLLTLIGAEAVECGLAKGAARQAEDLHQAMGLKEWHKAPGGGWYLMLRRGQDSRRSLEIAARKQRYEDYMKKIAPELERIDSELKDVREKGKAAEAEKKDLQRQYDERVKNIEASYRRDRKEAEAYAESNPQLAHRMRRRARQRRDDNLRELKRRMKPKADEITDEIRRLLQEMRRLQAERQKLLAGAPK